MAGLHLQQQGQYPQGIRDPDRLPTRTPDPRLLNEHLSGQELLDFYQQHGHAFDRVNLATCWSRLARVNAAERGWLQSNGGARLLALGEQTKEHLATFDALSVSLTAQAMAKLAIPGPAWGSLWTGIEGAALARVRDFKPQELSNTAWALAMVGRAAPALFD